MAAGVRENHRTFDVWLRCAIVALAALIIGAPRASAQATCPCSVWSSSSAVGPMDSQTGSAELGMKFTADTNGYVTGVRFYKYAQNTGTHVGNLWSASGALLATVTFTGETASGWQQASFPTPVAITANTTYVISYHINVGYYAGTTNGFTSAIDNAPLHALASGTSGGNGVYSVGTTPTFPNQTWNASNYWVDLVFASTPPDTTPPTVSSVTPTANATGVSIATAVTATFSEALNASTVTGTNVVLQDPSHNTVSATVSYNASTMTATLTPSALLAYATAYTATIKGGTGGVTDLAGNALATNFVWTFTTAADTTPPTVSGMTPAVGATGVPITTAVTATFSEAMNVSSINTSTVLLTNPSNGVVPATVVYNTSTFTATLTPNAALAPSTTYTATVEGGAGGVTDLAGNAMTANTTWSFTTAAPGPTCPCSIWSPTSAVGPMSTQAAAGELGLKFRSDVNGYILAVRFYKYGSNSGTHIGNLWNASGTRLATVTYANETSSGWQQALFSTPVAITANTTYVVSYHTTTGFYAATDQGLASSVDNAPLHALSNAAAGGNGVYIPGASAFPNQTYNSSNYWVDVVFSTTSADTIPPVVTGATPAAGAMGVSTSSPVTINFSEALDSTTVSASTIDLRTATNTVVPTTIAYNSSNWTVTLTPKAALASGATYMVTVRSGVKDPVGNSFAGPVSWEFATAPTTVSPTQGTGGPILIVTNTANTFTQYYPEILRAEGLTEFNVSDISQVSPTTLAAYDVVVLGQQTLTASQATMFTNWVAAGGNLIAMRPDSRLYTMLGLSASTGTTSNAYLAIDPTHPAGAGLETATLQFHGTADEHAATTATVLATLYSDATHATAFPAVTLAASQNGQAAAFAFDLAQSIIYTRQGNPAWAGTERDGSPPIRADDMYYGAKSGDIEPDWVDLTKVAIPQADEQQRLLANLILLMNGTKRPLPRFWYLPRGAKAAIVMTGDDHASGGVPTRFNDYLAKSAPGCSVANWECVRGTAYIYPATPMTDSQVSSYIAQGFEIALHVTMDPTTQFGCGLDFTPSTLLNAYNTQLSQFKSKFPSAGTPATHRMHCITWSDWSTQAATELGLGIRLDTSYYYDPASWVQDRPGFFTGSGMPMRYATITGTPIDVYQATTQMTDESGQTYPMTPNTLIANALGPAGYYGVLTANMHTDASSSQPLADSIVAAAQSAGVPVVTSKQMLTWLDARNGSAFQSIAWNGATLTFSVVAAANANGLQVMIPAQSGTAHLVSMTLNGAPVSYALQTIKGLSYAFVTAAAGQYAVTYQ